MAVKTFTQGEKLTYTDTNTYLANGGLVYVAGGSFTNATTVDVTGISSTYPSYRLIYQHRRTDTAGQTAATFQFRDSSAAISAGYYYGSGAATYLGALASLANGNNVANAYFVAADSFAAQSPLVLDIFVRSGQGVTWTGNGYFTGAAYALFYGGAVADSRVIDRLRVTYGVANSASGTWRLYGYREP